MVLDEAVAVAEAVMRPMVKPPLLLAAVHLCGSRIASDPPEAKMLIGNIDYDAVPASGAVVVSEREILLNSRERFEDMVRCRTHAVIDDINHLVGRMEK